jgi:hypothetical protein
MGNDEGHDTLIFLRPAVSYQLLGLSFAALSGFVMGLATALVPSLFWH